MKKGFVLPLFCRSVTTVLQKCYHCFAEVLPLFCRGLKIFALIARKKEALFNHIIKYNLIEFNRNASPFFGGGLASLKTGAEDYIFNSIREFF